MALGTMTGFDHALNMVETGGMFGVRRRLGTMTIHYLEKRKCYAVSDDWNKGVVLSDGYVSPDEAETRMKWLDDKRLCNS